MHRPEWHTVNDREEGEINVYPEDATTAYLDHLQNSLEEIDRLAEAGLCQYSLGGKHSFLQDIRRVIAQLGIQGGLTSYRS